MRAEDATPLELTGLEGRFRKAPLCPPPGRAHVWIAAEIDRRPPFLYALRSRAKRRGLAAMKAAAGAARGGGAQEANVFEALIVPPGRGRYLRARPEVHVARFDAVLLAAFDTSEAARAWLESEAAKHLLAELDTLARHVRAAVLEDARSMGPVDHGRQGVFLFNHFVAESAAQNLAVWEHTAGWFAQVTGLDNSTLMRPRDPAATDYTIINHCRWDSLAAILPALLFRPSFRRFVLRAFELNRTAAIPVLYRLA